MKCPNCDSENNDSAKFCKKCGTSLKNIENVSASTSNNNTTKIAIVVLIIIAVVLAGTLIYIYGNNLQSQQANTPVSDNNDNSNNGANSVESSSSQAKAKSPSMKIKGGSFSTGSELADKTYASIFVGSEHSGEKVTIQIYYSRDGNTLNNGNMVPNHVDSSGYIHVRSADSYRYYPDHAKINLYDESGNNLLDSKEVSLSAASGTQNF